MRAEQRIVRDIQHTLAVGRLPAQTDGATLAREYAQMCREVNERIDMCRRYVASGLYGQAVEVAERPPPLLDIVALLDFPKAAEWSAIATKQGWDVPPPLDKTVADCVNGAYSSANALEPSIAVFRRAVHQGDTRECVRMLKQLARLDAANQRWTEDLRSFEEKRLSEMERELRNAERERDSMPLQTIVEELSEKWVVSEAAGVLARAEALLKTVREEEAMRQGEAVLKALTNAYEAFDFDAMGEHLSRYEAILNEGFLRPTPRMGTQYDEAHQWHRREQEQRDKDQEFNALLAALTTELQKPEPTEDIEPIWNKIAAFDRAVDEDLEIRAKRAIETVRVLDRRRKAVLAVAAAVTGILVIAAGAVGFAFYRYQREVHRWTAQIDERVRNGDLDACRGILDQLRGYRPVPLAGEILEAAQCQAAKRRVGDMADGMRQASLRFAGLESEISVLLTPIEEAARRDGVRAKALAEAVGASREQLLAKMSESKGCAARLSRAQKTLGLDRDPLSVVAQREKTWTELQRRAQELIDDEYVRRLGEVSKRIPAAADRAQMSSAQLTQAVDELQRSLAALGQLPSPSPAIADQYERVRRELAEIAKGSGEKQQAMAAIGNSRSLVQYLDTLKEYSNRFPDDRLSVAINAILERRSSYENFAACPPNAEIAPNAFLDRVCQLADVIRDDNVLWASVVKSFAAREKRVRDRWLSGGRVAIAALGGDETLVSLTHLTYVGDDGRSVPAFLRGRFAESGTPAKKYYEGFIYVPQTNDVAVDFVKRRLPAERIPRQQRMAHAAYVTNLVGTAAATGPEDAALFLLRSIDELRDIRDVFGAFLRVKLMRYLGEKAVDLVGPGAFPPLDDVLRELTEADDPQMSWLCLRTPAVIGRTTNQCERALAKIRSMPSLAKGLALRSSVEKQCLARGVRWIGYAALEGNNAWQGKGGDPKEIWVVRIGAAPVLPVVDGRLIPIETGPCVLVAGEFVPTSGRLVISESLIPGEPLFAPSDAGFAHTREHATKFVREAKTMGCDMSGIWPPVWPKNRRE